MTKGVFYFVKIIFWIVLELFSKIFEIYKSMEDGFEPAWYSWAYFTSYCKKFLALRNFFRNYLLFAVSTTFSTIFSFPTTIFPDREFEPFLTLCICNFPYYSPSSYNIKDHKICTAYFERNWNEILWIIFILNNQHSDSSLLCCLLWLIITIIFDLHSEHLGIHCKYAMMS